MHAAERAPFAGAKWIWLNGDPNPNERYVYFRKTFDLGADWKQVVYHITAERYYRLWVNGQCVGRGPALGHPADKSYDTYDVSELVRPGRNTIACLAFWDGFRGYFMEPTRPGLLCSIDLRMATGESRAVVTDASWRCQVATAWDSAAPKYNDHSFQEIYYASRELKEWQNSGFDDKRWDNAVEIAPAESDGSQTTPWRRLVPRDIPFLDEEALRPCRVRVGEVIEWLSPLPAWNTPIPIVMSLEPVHKVKKAQIHDVQHLSKPVDGGCCVIENSDRYEPLATFDGLHDATLILDFGSLVQGYLAIDAEGESGAMLDIGYSPNLRENRVMPFRSLRAMWSDRLILDGTRTSFQTFQRRYFRYVQLTLRNANGPVKLYGVTAHRISYPFPRTSKFQCSDKDLVRIWKACDNSLTFATTDVITDGMREGKQYGGDAMHSLRASGAIHGDSPINYRYIRQMNCEQLEDGSFPAGITGELSTDAYPDCDLDKIICCWYHFERFGEVDILGELWPKVNRNLAYFTKCSNDRGLLEIETIPHGPDPGSRSTGWFVYLDGGENDRRGENLALNGLYLLALRAGASMARILGDSAAAANLERSAARVEQSLRTFYWNDELGLFADTVVNGEQSSHVSEHAQGIMLYLGLATPSQAERIVRAWQRDPEMLGFAEPGFLIYCVEGLVRYGYAEFAMDLMRSKYRHFIDRMPQVGEFWSGLAVRSRGASVDGERSGAELDFPWRTLDAREVAMVGPAGWAADSLLRHIVGIQMERMDMPSEQVLRLAPQPVVDWAKGQWYDIKVSWRRSATDWRFSMHSPDPIRVELVIPYDASDVERVVINGRTSTQFEKVVRLEQCKNLAVQVFLNNSQSD